MFLSRLTRGVDFSHGRTSEDRLANPSPGPSGAADGFGGCCILGLFFLPPGRTGCRGWGEE
ncbi:hypothetical protein NSPZN2_11527 [Nitrospira defluvii]|uniref:Uncharacterized protein n=1 Tax=Nitrospira defluvii TaxID=330214 RepID=A0ABM8QVH0_9BACT|nr:hypothetical protein NSPZN2_11527 [Nitrospira defluvii]